ncbi:MAG: acyl-CoA dehydrogenase C-terminal domain-containing protein [Pseudomonadales bacterium]
MQDYKAPLRDMQFVLFELLDVEKHYQQLPAHKDVTRELLDAVIQEAAKFAENVLSPLYQSGDEEGCSLSPEGVVTTPSGFKEAYQQYVANGWPAMSAPEEMGGQGLPHSFGGIVNNELIGSANWAWSMYPGLSHGAKVTIETHGSPEQQNLYLPKMVEGSWTGTMCLTEAHSGTDLGLLRTKAEPNPDGSYSITGTKIFISAGDHDLAENIVHIVLARLPDAPGGTKGISLFIVPKFTPNADGEAGDRNAVSCGSIEHKMGINGSATCVLNFDGATGYLIGEPNRGLAAMFTFMNTARVGTAIQGLCSAERAYQGALAYARERLQMRSLSGPKNPEAAADPIIVHPNVRRMLLTQKAFAEGGRAFIYWLGTLLDVMHDGEEEAAKQCEDLLSFLTPIAKAFLTETGLEAASYGVQVYGGHGYIKEWGMEQIARDARIATIYEGTTGVQSIDLIGRKVLGSGGELLKNYTKIIHQFCKQHGDDADLAEFVEPLNAINKELGELTMHIGGKAMENAEEAGAASVDYLMYSGYIVLAHMWAQMAAVANAKLAAGTEEEDFYRAKITTARLYYQRLLPRTLAHKAAIMAGAQSLMELDEAHFKF